MPFNKIYSALYAFLAQVQNQGDWTVENLKYAGVINFTNMITNDKVQHYKKYFSV